MNFLEVLKGWKTVIFNIIMLGIMILQQQGVIAPEGAPTADEVNAWMASFYATLSGVWAVGNLILRAITNSTMFKKTSPAPDPKLGG